jgi:hypothetical protein
MPKRFVAAAILIAALITARSGSTQTISQRGFVEVRGTGFAQEAPNDSTRAVADLLAREEVFIRPAPWLRLAAGADLRANSHDQIDDRWRVDLGDRAGCGRRFPSGGRPRRSREAPSPSMRGSSSSAGARPISSVRPTASPLATSSTSSIPSSWPSAVSGRRRKPASRTHSRLSGCRG